MNASTRNNLLAVLPPNEYKRMQPFLEEVELKFNTKVLEVGDMIRHVYFPNSGIIALLASGEENLNLIACLVGREGMVGGMSLLMSEKTAAGQAIVQGKGTAMRMKVTDFQNECRHGGVLPGLLVYFTESIMRQILQSTVCFRFHTVENRLARWLLMTCDRMEANEFQMTQVFLSNMIGVRRERVTLAARALRKKDLISYSRGNMMIIDRPGLEHASCSCYSLIREVENRLPGSDWNIQFRGHGE